MRVLVTWGSKMGGTKGIGRALADELRDRGFEVDAVRSEDVRGLAGYDAIIVGGGLYANRWVASARRFVTRHAKELRKVPVWLFSSGPLDDSADREELPPSNQVAVLGERVGAKGHVTFGGCLAPTAEGFPAKAMAKTHAGDWRNFARVRQWAAELAEALPDATPGRAIDHPARSLPRMLAHGALGWALCAASFAGMFALFGRTAAVAVHDVFAPLLFVALAWHYFRGRGARDPLPTAAVWTGLVALLDVVLVAGAIEGSFAMFTSIAQTWLPLALVFLATWATGALMSTLPWPKPSKATDADRLAHSDG